MSDDETEVESDRPGGYHHTNSRGVTYFLHRTQVTLLGGRPQSIHYFAKSPKSEKGVPVGLPAGRQVVEIPRTGFLAVRHRTELVDNAPADTNDRDDGSGQGLFAADALAGQGLVDSVGLVHDLGGREFVVDRFFRSTASPLSLPATILQEAIRDPEVTEADLQRILEAHPELIPGDYFEACPQIYLEPAGRRLVPDFMLRPVDDLWDVLEIKRPQLRVVAQSGAHERFSYQMAAAIQQVRDYSAALLDSSVRERLLDRYGIDTLRPRLMLIAGSAVHPKTLRRLAADGASGVDVYTWDQVVEINKLHGRRF